MCSSVLQQRYPCRKALFFPPMDVCTLCKRCRVLMAFPTPASARRKDASKFGLRVQGCAVAAPERHHTLYRSELGYRTDFSEHYSLLEIIGKGNYGTVWLAASRQDASHQVAVKVVPKSRDDRSHEETLEGIRREVAMWGSLSGDSPYVAELLGLYEDGRSVYLVQQLCHGGDLSEALKDGPLPESCCAAIMWCVLSAIRDCHDHRLALMDVKPQNFLLTAAVRNTTAAFAEAEGLARKSTNGGGGGGSSSNRNNGTASTSSAGDAGCACGCGGGSSGVRQLRLEDQIASGSRTPCVVACDFGCSLSYTELMRGAKRAGSPVFFAPEQFTNTYGLVVDEWAAGVMLYLLLTGRYPFWDCKRDDMDKSLPAYQVMLAVCSAPITFNGPEWRGISREARDLASQLLDRNPGTRLTAGAALQHPWFARWMQTTAASSVSSSLVGRGDPDTSVKSSAVSSQQQRQQRRRRSTPVPQAAEPSSSAAMGLGGPPLSACCGGGGGAASNIVPLLSSTSYAPVPVTLPTSMPNAAGAPGDGGGEIAAEAMAMTPKITAYAVAVVGVAGSDDDDPFGCEVAHGY